MKTAAQIRAAASDAQIVAARFAGSKICGRCAEAFVGKLCPKCTPVAVLRGRANAFDGLIDRAVRGEFDTPPCPPKATPSLVLRLTGQVRGGKNAMGVTKSGRHYAKAPFKKWRAEMFQQICNQEVRAISEPTNVRIDYVAGDRKRRDQTGIFDALFHLLEYAQVVTDDSLLWVTESSRRYDKAAPGVTITFL